MAIGPGAPDASEPARTWPATFGCSCETRTSSPRPSRIASGRSSPLRVTGLTNRQIAARLHVTQSTVRTHLSWAFGRLGVHSRGEAVLLLACDEKLRRDVLTALDRSAAPARPQDR